MENIEDDISANHVSIIEFNSKQIQFTILLKFLTGTQ